MSMLNDRDVLLQSTVPRLGSTVRRDLLLTLSATEFKVNRDNIASPPAITLKPLFVGMSGTVTYELPEGVTLTYPGGVATLEYANMPDSSATITAVTTVAGVVYRRPATITKKFDTTSAAVYTWVKFGTSSAGAGLSNSPVGATYIGLAFNKNVPSESVLASDYRWYPINGTANTGVAGDVGADGQQLFAWIKYSDSPDGLDLYDTPTASTMYIGLAVNQSSPLEGTEKSLYVWSKYGGDTGVPAQTGGTTFTWIKYGSSITGANLSDDPTGLDYIGFAYNKPTPVESTNPGDYQWSLFRGGQGTPGQPGSSFFTWIKYADAPDGTGLYDLPNEETLYIGIAVNKSTATESNLKTDYVWSRFKGAQGVPGVGQDGVRGNINISAATTANAWFDADAAVAVAAAGYGQPRARDIVALYNSSTGFVATKIFTGSAWTTLAAFFDGSLLVKGTVFADAIVAGAITADKIAASAVTADKLAAKSVTAMSIVVGTPDNVVPDANFDDVRWWGRPGQQTPDYAGNNASPWRSRRSMIFTPQQNSVQSDTLSEFFPMTPGAVYKAEFQIEISSDFQGYFSPYFHLPQQSWYTLDLVGRGYNWGSTGLPVYFDAGSTKGFQTFTAFFTMGASTAQNRAQIRLTVTCTQGYIQFGGVSLTRMSDSSLVVNGGIKAYHIQVDSLSAMTGIIGDLQTATYGKRTRIRDNKIYQYDIYNNYIMQIGEYE